MKRRNCDVTSIQNIPDRKRVEAITISRQTRSKMRPIGLGAQCGAGHNKTVRQSPADDAPSVQLHAQPLHAPSADASGRATRLVRTPHRTDGDPDGQIFWTGGASPPPNRDAQGVHRRIEAGQDGQIRRRRRRTMMTFAALVVAAILVASTLYAMFSRTR
jgi:hypothetical protein